MLRYDCVIRITPSLRTVCHADLLRVLGRVSIMSEDCIVLRALGSLSRVSTKVLRVLDIVSTMSTWILFIYIESDNFLVDRNLIFNSIIHRDRSELDLS